MKQLLQNLKTGEIEFAEIPCSVVKSGRLLIRTRQSLVSTGTERMLMEFGKAGWMEKARQQPDKVRMVLDKIKTDGLLPTIEVVRNKLDQPLSMGYCNVGTVMEVGSGVTGFQVGDRVASNGKHAEVVSVPMNLCAKVPEAVSDEEAAFTVIGAIALQGIRLMRPTLGEAVVVTGLGLIGLMTVQLLRAHGCRVLGIDFDPDRLKLARQFGAEALDLSAGEDPVAAALGFSRGRGVDGVIVAAATKSSEPMHQAALMCRKRGRIVLVGVAGLDLSRADFFEKELSFQVSCSYGPGRYDADYEEKGQDYPVGYVRWTEQRNFEAVLDMLADGRFDVKPLISHRFPFERAMDAYKLVGGDSPSLGILLQYSGEIQSPNEMPEARTYQLHTPQYSSSSAVVGLIGAGNFAAGVLIPSLKRTGARLKAIASNDGTSGAHIGRKYGFEQCTTDADKIFNDPEINVVAIATRHDSHAQLICRALNAGKHVFLEKPLALTRNELSEIETLYAKLNHQHSSPLLMVGFNRRFAPQVKLIKSLLDGARGPKSFIMTVNAGSIPSTHWAQDPSVGGGRIIGEACHFIDLLRFLAGRAITGVQVTALNDSANTGAPSDKVSFTLRFADGSFGTVHYLANGHKSFPKERLEVFCAGRVLQLDNFRKLRGYGWPGFKRKNLWFQDKGHKAELAAFIHAVQNGDQSPIPFVEILEVTRASFDVAEAAR